MIVEWKARAQRDLSGQLRYISKDKPGAALRMNELTNESAQMLGSWPNLGKKTRHTGVLEYVVPKTPFVLQYRIDLQTVTIIRLYHAAQSR